MMPSVIERARKKTGPPDWLLQSRSPNVDRLVVSWKSAQTKLFEQRVQRTIRFPLSSGFELPKATPWRPPVISTVPCTSVLVRALHTGVLRKRLEMGIERIYISDMALLCAPSSAPRLLELAHALPTRLVITPIVEGTFVAESLNIKKPLAVEYFRIGCDLTNAYEEEYQFDRCWNRNALDDVYRLRIGSIPRGIPILTMHEQPVLCCVWEQLDEMEGIRRIIHQARFARKRQGDQALKAMAQIFARDK